MILPEGLRFPRSCTGSVAVNGDFARFLHRTAILMLVAGSVTACGRKGSLEPPPKGNAVQTPGEQAAAAHDAAVNGSATNEDQQTPAPASPTGGIASLRAKKPPPVLPPKTPFILDPLLR
jgi:predicted small lipoprotein YifL